jgi:hypothetical protein
VQAGHGPGRDRAGKAPGGEENTQVRRIPGYNLVIYLSGAVEHHSPCKKHLG